MITLHNLLFIIILLFKEQLDNRCICKYASVFIFFHSYSVENCTEVICKFSFMMIERWSNSWCRSMCILHLHILNYVFSLLKTKSIFVNWLWVLQVIMSNFSSNSSLALIMMLSKLLIVACWVKDFHFS